MKISLDLSFRALRLLARAVVSGCSPTFFAPPSILKEKSAPGVVWGGEKGDEY